jgi:phage protein D
MALLNRVQKEAAPHSVDVSIDGVAVDYTTVERVDIDLRENEHDLATLVLAGISPLSITDYVDRPVKIKIGVSYSEGFTFCGYVNHVKPSHKVTSGRVNGSLFQEAHLYCLGASSVMRGKKNRVWNDFRVSQMVSDLSIAYNLSYSCPDSTPTIPRLVQRGTSDWEILVRACRYSGLAVNVHGTEIHVHDPMQAIRYGAPSARLSTVADPVGHDSLMGRILEFDAALGTSHAYGDVNPEQISILDDTGALLTAKSSDLLVGAAAYGAPVTTGTVDVLPVEAISMKDARRKLSATRASSDAYVAKVSTTGVAGPIPGSVVRLAGFASKFDGVWLVRELNMKFNRGHFITEFGIGRRTQGDDYRGQAPMFAYDVAPEGRLQSGTWRSSLRRAHVYSSN